MPRSSTPAEKDAAEKRRPYRRTQIVEAAATLFEQRGFLGTGMDQLGTAVGISGPAIYRHFAGKDAVLAAVLDTGQDLLLRPFRERLRLHEPGAETLQWLVEHYLSGLREWPALTGLILGGRTIRDPDTDSKLRRYHRDYAHAMAASLSQVRPTLAAADVDMRVQLALSVGRLFQVYPWIAAMDSESSITRRFIDEVLLTP